MLNQLLMIPDRLHELLEIVEKNMNKYAMFISVVILQFVLLGSYSQVSGQEGATIDVNEMYQNEAVKMPYVLSGDEGANNLSLKATGEVSDLTLATAKVFGSDSVVDGSRRSDEVGMSTMAREGLLGTVDSEVTAMLLNPPGIDLPGHLMAQWVPGQSRDTTVYAQGAGYNLLKNDIGLEPIWEMFRNIAYAGFVIVLMVAGFMIMFRSKIGGQVTVGIMNTIPGVLTGLVLVAFSFAIVGFIIDLGRLASIIFMYYMNSQLGGSGFEAQTLPNNPISLAWNAFEAVPIVQDLTSPVSLIGGAGLMKYVPIVGPITTAVGGLIILAVGLICLYASIKVFVTLITSYIKIIIDLVMGPLYILMGSLPGKSAGIVNWLKRLVSNTLTFPVVLIILNLSRYVGYSSISTLRPLSFMSGGEGGGGFIFEVRGFVVIAGYLIAAGAPGMIDEALAVVASKGTMAAVEGAKKTAGKIPIIGGFLG